MKKTTLYQAFHEIKNSEHYTSDEKQTIKDFIQMVLEIEGEDHKFVDNYNAWLRKNKLTV